MYQRILVALGGPDEPQRVGAHALNLAKACGSTCLLLHVIEAIDGDGDPETQAFYGRMEQRAHDWLDAARRQFEEAGVKADVRTVVGRRWEAIIDQAADENADLIVIGSRPTLDEGKLQLGSTSHGVFFAARCPLLVVRDKE